MEIQKKLGLSAALPTPFTATADVNPELYASHALHCLQQGCHSVTALGTTGEGAALGMQTREKLLRSLHDAGIGAKQLIVGIAACDQNTATLQIRQAIEHDAGYILVPPPFYFKGVSQQGIKVWYSELINSIGAVIPPILLYHIPSQTAVNISVELISQLRDEFGAIIAGVKDSGSNWQDTERLLAAHRDIAILIGDERHLAAALQSGAQGAICGVANLVPDTMRALIDSAEQDSYILDLVELLLDYPIVPALKTLLAHQYDDLTWARVSAPLCPLSESEFQALISRYRALSLK